ncbi:MAG: hypothetical protein U0Z70_13185 [Thermomicrobiales bacterium]
MHSVRALTRRRLLAAAVALALAGGSRLAGARGTPVAAPAVNASAFPVTISHDFGEPTIPALPRRIVVPNQAEELNSLLALGALPVGMVKGRGSIIDALSLELSNAVADANTIIAPDYLPDQTAVQEANAPIHALPAVQRGGYMLLPPEMAQALYIESALSAEWGAWLTRSSRARKTWASGWTRE